MGLPLVSPHYVYTHTGLPLRQGMVVVVATDEHDAKVILPNNPTKKLWLFIYWGQIQERMLKFFENPAFILLIASMFSNNTAIGQQSSQQWKLVWNDEFEYTGLPDDRKWNYDVGGHGWGNNELEYYTAKRMQNARVENGHLIIEAIREAMEGKEYSSARLVTRDRASWNHGKIEVRAKLPKGLGTWPAIWMLADTRPLKWPEDGEIDIMEHVGYNQGRVHGTIHTLKYIHTIGTQKANQINVNNCSEEFHTYQLEWSQDTLKIGMDNQYYFTYTNEGSGYSAWPFNNKHYLILNVAVGGNWGGSKGVDTTIWPQRMVVDYVRVYQKN